MNNMAAATSLLLLCLCFLPSSFALSRALLLIKDDDVDAKEAVVPNGLRGRGSDVVGVGFLQNLVGTQNGDTVEGLRHVKQYLHRFGYLETTETYSPASTSAQLLDTYDDRLEAAIRTYQLNYNLNVTGKLDARTVAQMMKPRCGVPDLVINGTTTSMNSGGRGKIGAAAHRDDHNDHQPTLGPHHVVLNYKVNPERKRWEKTQLTYAFLNSANALSSVTARAFGKWSAVTGFSFQEVADPETADIKIGFFAREHGDSGAFDGPGGVLAHSYMPTIGKFHLDQEETWSFSTGRPGFDEMDLESVAVHEMGHLLGLVHSFDPEAIMYPTIRPGVVKRELTQDDIDGISDLYNL